ncbi:MAG TPA: hypothetical protein VHA77_06460 [Xanthobacteraceae bacterium]|jgi:hypothetical protein|nr:hypothetical protein [Xanthobacteraceae bacterium]
MCDYSLHDVASRPAKVGDKLVTTGFRNSLTRGFASIDNPLVAVCLRPGTELAFETEVEYDHPFRRLLPRFGFGKLGQKMARFRQINMNRPHVHHDALEMADGRIVLLTRLCEGQRATVLQVPPQAMHEDAEEARHSDEPASIRT